MPEFSPPIQTKDTSCFSFKIKSRYLDPILWANTTELSLLRSTRTLRSLMKRPRPRILSVPDAAPPSTMSDMPHQETVEQIRRPRLAKFGGPSSGSSTATPVSPQSPVRLPRGGETGRARQAPHDLAVVFSGCRQQCSGHQERLGEQQGRPTSRAVQPPGNANVARLPVTNDDPLRLNKAMVYRVQVDEGIPQIFSNGHIDEIICPKCGHGSNPWGSNRSGYGLRNDQQDAVEWMIRREVSSTDFVEVEYEEESVAAWPQRSDTSWKRDQLFGIDRI
ncbi:hypothetical protein QBC38DRAFT_504709 [Podospora fimiseda]|uniref:Uncharacterized protein n=1 Tax=Podospora fimiseda TaxID=252190 RepID=A0AAN6YLV3_9PEZI|nr:hypothetical protein QBC38DRAFT_504709 [Podospora fimiseda]